MNLPEYWLAYPEVSTTEGDEDDFEALFREAMEQPRSSPLDYSLAAPKWRFLDYVVERHPIVLHGSGNPDIERLAPREANDLNAFGNQRAVYATADGIWATFFAIVDRDTYPMTVNNACIQWVDHDERDGDRYYVFSISQDVLGKQPWRRGVVYLLPAESFAQQPEVQFGDHTIRVPQLASRVPVEPLSRIDVGPEDFPFLRQIRGHDDARLTAYAEALQTGGAWPDAAE